MRSMGLVNGRSLMSCCFAAVVAMAAIQASGGQQTPAPAKAIDPAIEAVWARLDKAWNDRDARAFAAVFTADATFEIPKSIPGLNGREAIEKHFAAQFPTSSPLLRHRATVTAAHDVSAELTLVDGGVEILRTDASGVAEPTIVRKFALSAGMQRTKDGWSIRWLRAYQMP
jgi:uncharacterized protein (TIGR02246 family)